MFNYLLNHFWKYKLSINYLASINSSGRITEDDYSISSWVVLNIVIELLIFEDVLIGIPACFTI